MMRGESGHGLIDLFPKMLVLVDLIRAGADVLVLERLALLVLPKPLDGLKEDEGTPAAAPESALAPLFSFSSRTTILRASSNGQALHPAAWAASDRSSGGAGRAVGSWGV